MNTPDIHLLAWVISAFSSTLLLSSAWHKLQDLPLFHSHLHAYGLLPVAWVTAAGYVLPLAEGWVALLLWLPTPGRWGHWMAVGLVLLYAAAMATHVLRGRRDLACGCGGPGLHVGWALVGRNLGLAALIGWAAGFYQNLDNPILAAIATASGFMLWVLYVLTEKIWGFTQRIKPSQGGNSF